MSDSKVIVKDAKKLFIKLGTCSRTLFYILNREFGFPMETEEHAVDPLAGGIMQQGYQCGMLWGTSLAVGAESFRRNNDPGDAIGMAITTTQRLMESFSKRTKHIDCIDITECDWTSKIAMAKFMLTGSFLSCLKLAKKWAPEAIQSATDGFSHEQSGLSLVPKSCATEVAQKMGATDEEMVMVAGFAGGLGLSGNACGALSAAIWMNTLAWCREHTGKSVHNNPNAKNTLESFYGAANYEMLCQKISGQSFKTIDDHTEFINNDGCDKLINTLAQS